MPLIGFDDFSAGLWIKDEAAPTTEQAGFAVPSNGLLHADNIDYLPSGAIRGRRGSTRYNASPLPGAVTALTRLYARESSAFRVGQGYGITFPDALNFPSHTAPWSGASLVWSPFSGAARALGIGTNITTFLARLGGFFFNPLPADATVTGIVARVIRRKTPGAGTVTDADVRLVMAGAVVLGAGANRASATPWRAGAYELATYGTPTDLWGAAPSAADVNGFGFGVAIAAEFASAAQVAEVNFIRLDVYYSSTAGDRFVAAAVAAGDLVYYTGAGGSFTPIPGGTLVNPPRRPTIVAWPQKGKLFLFDGVNPAQQYDGALMQAIPPDIPEGDAIDLATYAAPPRGPYAALFKNRLYATEPGELDFSVYASDINNERRWRPALQLSVNDDRGGRITGLAPYGDSLLIFKDTAVFRFYGDPEFGAQLTELSPVGCVAPASIAVSPFGVIFVGHDGVWLTDGDHVVSLSDAVRPLFVGRSTASKWEHAVGVYYPRREQYWLHLDPAAAGPGYILHRLKIPTRDGDREQLAWSRIPDLPLNCGTTWEGDAGELYLGDRSGFVWLRDTGTTDNGVAIDSSIVTPQRLVAERQLARVQRIKPIYRGAAPLALGLRYDQAVTDSLTVDAGATLASPEIQEPRQYLLDKSVFGRFVSVRARSQESSAWELHRLDLDIRRRGGRVWR